MKLAVVLIFLLALLAPPTKPSQSVPTATYRIPTSMGDGWKTANAEALGVDSKQLAALTQSIRSWPELGVHAILIDRRGQLIYEEYFDGFDERWGQPLGRVSMKMDVRHDLRSMTKSVVSALFGIAIAEGSIPSLDQPVVKWFPEYPELDTPERRRVTLAHVLSMTSGFEWNESVPYNDPRNDEIRMTRDREPLRYALSRSFAHQPGDEFNYNGGLTHVLAAVLERATKVSIRRLRAKKAVRTSAYNRCGVGWRSGGNACCGIRIENASARCCKVRFVIFERGPMEWQASHSSFVDRSLNASSFQISTSYWMGCGG